jgi:hypothetical protein
MLELKLCHIRGLYPAMRCRYCGQIIEVNLPQVDSTNIIICDWCGRRQAADSTEMHRVPGEHAAHARHDPEPPLSPSVIRLLRATDIGSVFNLMVCIADVIAFVLLYRGISGYSGGSWWLIADATGFVTLAAVFAYRQPGLRRVALVGQGLCLVIFLGSICYFSVNPNSYVIWIAVLRLLLTVFLLGALQLISSDFGTDSARYLDRSTDFERFWDFFCRWRY